MISYHKHLWEDQQSVGFESMLSGFPTNAIVTRWPRCATLYIEISYFVFMTLSCQILFAMNKCIWYFGLVLHNTISSVKHMDLYFKLYDRNKTIEMQPKLYLFVHQNIFLLLKCIKIDLSKIKQNKRRTCLEAVV
jgi:hypothetical protein